MTKPSFPIIQYIDQKDYEVHNHIGKNYWDSPFNEHINDKFRDISDRRYEEWRRSKDYEDWLLGVKNRVHSWEEDNWKCSVILLRKEDCECECDCDEY